MNTITILTGFLGAGNTTLLNKLIESHPEKKFGLIINEFGEVGIDGELVSQQVSEEQTYEISSGCICCVVRGDLIKGVDKVISSNDIDYLIIETSGLAEPMPVAQTFEVDNVVAIVDCENVQDNVTNYAVLAAEVAAADIIVLNKVEELTHEQITEIKNTIKLTHEQITEIKNTITWRSLKMQSTKYALYRAQMVIRHTFQ
jgi:G3E family GTPase